MFQMSPLQYTNRHPLTVSERMRSLIISPFDLFQRLTLIRNIGNDNPVYERYDTESPLSANAISTGSLSPRLSFIGFPTFIAGSESGGCDPVLLRPSASSSPPPLAALFLPSGFFSANFMHQSCAGQQLDCTSPFTPCTPIAASRSVKLAKPRVDISRWCKGDRETNDDTMLSFETDMISGRVANGMTSSANAYLSHPKVCAVQSSLSLDKAKSGASEPGGYCSCLVELLATDNDLAPLKEDHFSLLSGGRFTQRDLLPT